MLRDLWHQSLSHILCFLFVVTGNIYVYNMIIFFHGKTIPSGPRRSHCQGYTITLRQVHTGALVWTSDQLDAETYS
jgi:hypothetical protein